MRRSTHRRGSDSGKPGRLPAYAHRQDDDGMAEGAFRRIDRPDIDEWSLPGGNFPTMDGSPPGSASSEAGDHHQSGGRLWAVLQEHEGRTRLSRQGVSCFEQLPAG